MITSKTFYQQGVRVQNISRLNVTAVDKKKNKYIFFKFSNIFNSLNENNNL